MAKSADIKYAYEGERVVLFDLTRSQQEHFNYEVMESVKNGTMFSGKYESKVKVYASPHVVVFANWLPDYSKLSMDRWDVWDLDESVPPECKQTLTLRDIFLAGARDKDDNPVTSTPIGDSIIEEMGKNLDEWCK